MRIHLAGRIEVESDERLLDEAQLPARQGRIAFAYLALNRRRPVPQGELAEALWGDEPPHEWMTTVRALLSRLRRLLKPEAAIETKSGSVTLDVPGDVWVDIEAARIAVDEAEGSIRRSRFQDAWGPASVAAVIAQRGFLPGEELAWVVNQRESLRLDLLRALDCLTDISLELDQPALALRYANESVRLEPYRESSYERIIRAHISTGNRAEALRTYQNLRRLLADELGIDPSPRVAAAHLAALRM